MSVRLIAELAACDSLGGCAAYVALRPAGGPEGPETRLSMLGPRQVTQGLPATLAPGAYHLDFRSVLVSDEIVNGQPASEQTDARCAIDIVTPSGPSLGTGVEILVVFGPGSCEASATYSMVNA